MFMTHDSFEEEGGRNITIPNKDVESQKNKKYAARNFYPIVDQADFAVCEAGCEAPECDTDIESWERNSITGGRSGMAVVELETMYCASRCSTTNCCVLTMW
jgi:hypothetical protein